MINPHQPVPEKLSKGAAKTIKYNYTTNSNKMLCLAALISLEPHLASSTVVLQFCAGFWEYDSIMLLWVV